MTNYEQIEINANGDKFYLKDGKLHREDGPAIEFVCGDCAWYQNGVPHREDGPAIDCGGDIKLYWIKGVQYTKRDFDKWIKWKTKSSYIEKSKNQD